MDVKDVIEKYEKELIQSALDARNKDSWAPFSNSFVGIAILTIDGKIYKGANVEFTRSAAMTHGEFVAMGKVMHDYISPKYKGKPTELAEKIKNGFDDIIAIAEVNSGGIPGCGPCRQMCLEVNPNMIFYGILPNGEIKVKKTIKELLPHEYRSNDGYKL